MLSMRRVLVDHTVARNAYQHVQSQAPLRGLRVTRRAAFCKATLPKQAGTRRTFVAFLSPRVNPKLRFTQYPVQRGHGLTVGGLFAVNVAVFVAWRVSVLDPSSHDRMQRFFTQRQDSLREGEVREPQHNTWCMQVVLGLGSAVVCVCVCVCVACVVLCGG